VASYLAHWKSLKLMSLKSERELMKKQYPGPVNESYFTERKPTSGFQLLDRVDLKDKLVLDLGAFGGYVGWHCAKRGARPVLIDLFSSAMPDYWPRVEGDKERLPFKDETFDLVACNDTLHHGGLVQTGGEVARVLRSGGIFISTREPQRASWESEDDVLRKDCAVELASGINERRPCLKEYQEFCRRFRSSLIFACHDMSPAKDLNYGGDGIAIWCHR